MLGQAFFLTFALVLLLGSIFLVYTWLMSRHSYRPGPLTPRQLQIVRLVAAGKPNKTIAGELRITEGTVKNHLTIIYDRLGIASRVGLALWYNRHYNKA